MDERFWMKVDRRGADECWEWTGAKYGAPDAFGKRYGFVKRNRRHFSAHRFAYTDAVGPIPAGMHILHSCDNPPCCNPSHLRPGTNADNQRDAAARGRNYVVRGEASPTCKFSDETIAAVRRLRSEGKSQRDVARLLGVSPTYVGQVTRGERRRAA
jgi:hypothetical protein